MSEQIPTWILEAAIRIKTEGGDVRDVSRIIAKHVPQSTAPATHTQDVAELVNPNDGQCDELVSMLDGEARNYDQYDYGLPTHDANFERFARAQIREFVNALQPARLRDTVMGKEKK